MTDLRMLSKRHGDVRRRRRRGKLNGRLPGGTVGYYGRLIDDRARRGSGRQSIRDNAVV